MMRRKCEINFFAVVGAMAIGAMIGVVTGLMLAPKSGNELREQLVTTGKDFVKKAKSKKDDFIDELEDEIEEIGDFTSDID